MHMVCDDAGFAARGVIMWSPSCGAKEVTGAASVRGFDNKGIGAKVGVEEEIAALALFPVSHKDPALVAVQELGDKLDNSKKELFGRMVHKEVGRVATQD